MMVSCVLFVVLGGVFDLEASISDSLGEVCVDALFRFWVCCVVWVGVVGLVGLAVVAMVNFR